jgi:hypothetical protein
MINHRVTGLSALAAATAACAFGLMAAPAGAAAMTFHDHETLPVAGDVFGCGNGDLTVTAGTISLVNQGTIDAQGIVHVTSTVVPHNVTLQDAAGNAYTISGADWFGGKFTGDPDDPNSVPIVFTDTEHFVIHTADGGVYAKVQIVEHLSPNGKVISFDLGGCETPQD